MNAIEEQVLDCFPSGSYALSALLRLVDIVESEQVPTAAVECRIQPRMLINPNFVSRHANTPERLLMLVMHELHHILLGHTTLFKTVTNIDNFVFDCVINALISRMFPHDENLSFLTEFYSDKKFPECLLRPPARWNGNTVKTLPQAIRELPETNHAEVAEVYRSLYSEMPKHLPHRLSCDTKTARSFSLAQSFNMARQPNAQIKIHGIHPPTFHPQKVGRLQVAEF